MVICRSRRIYLLKFTVVFSTLKDMAKQRSFVDINNVSCEFETQTLNRKYLSYRGAIGYNDIGDNFSKTPTFNQNSPILLKIVLVSMERFQSRIRPNINQHHMFTMVSK